MELRAVGRRYGGPGSPWVLREVDAALPEATVLRVTGDNGSGKSTLLRLLAGIDAPSRGRVTEVPRPVGYVPERFPVALPFGPLGYLTHQARIRGMRRRAAARTAREWLERFGAGGHTHTPMAELSKGTSQKVAVAQALLVRPRLLVLDEAWTGLDPAAREELDRVVAETVAAGGTVVYVDHHAERLADSVGQSWRVADGQLHVESAGTDGPDGGPAGPRVQVTVSGPPGAEPPPALPGSPRCVRTPGGELRLTVPAAASDALLRSLLAARPPWHVRAVRSVAPATAAAATAGETAPVAPVDAEDPVDTAPEQGRGPAAERPAEDTEPAEAAVAGCAAAEETAPAEGDARPEGAA